MINSLANQVGLCSGPLMMAHMPLFTRQLRNSLLELRGPMANGEKFVILDDNYLKRFDEIVVIGDIHGCYDEFKEMLTKLHSETPSKDPTKCLKILVGDLVNKGPKSEKVLKMCRDIYPDSILAVRGNHDEVILKQRQLFDQTKEPLAEKNRWIESINPRYIKYLSLLPYTIRIPSLKSIIVHAGLDPSLEDPAISTDPQLMLTMRNIIVHKDEKTNETRYECTKSNTEGACWANFWPGPEHIYFGHDARRRLQADHEFATGLDTGCVYGDSLTCVYIKGLRRGEIVCVKAKNVYVPV